MNLKCLWDTDLETFPYSQEEILMTKSRDNSYSLQVIILTLELEGTLEEIVCWIVGSLEENIRWIFLNNCRKKLWNRNWLGGTLSLSSVTSRTFVWEGHLQYRRWFTVHVDTERLWNIGEPRRDILVDQDVDLRNVSTRIGRWSTVINSGPGGSIHPNTKWRYPGELWFNRGTFIQQGKRNFQWQFQPVWREIQSGSEVNFQGQYWELLIRQWTLNRLTSVVITDCRDHQDF